MKRIALFSVLFATFISAASAEPSLITGKAAKIFVSVQLNDGQSSLPPSSLVIAEGSTGTVYVENALPYLEKAEKAQREKGCTAPSDSEEGITMLVTPTRTADGQIDLDFTIRKVVKTDPNADALQATETEVKHRMVVKNGTLTTVQVEPAVPAQVETAPAAKSDYTITVTAQKV